MRDASWKKVDDIIVESSVALLKASGVEAALVDASPSDTEPSLRTIAVMGFVGADLRGSVCVVASAEVLSRSRSAAGAGERDLDEWAGELARRLLDRIQGRLRPLGITIDLSTPTTLRGKDLTFGQAGYGAHSSRHSFRADGGDLLIRFAAQVRPSMTLAPDATNAEGDPGTV